MSEIDNIGRLLLETGRIGKQDYTEAIRISRETGKSLPEIFLASGKVSVDELVQALTIHMDITLLKEALGMEQGKAGHGHLRPLGSYLERISLLFKTGMLLSHQKNVGTLIDVLIREAPTVMNAERATIFLADHEKHELYSHLALGIKNDEIRIPWTSGIAGWVFTHGKSLNIVDPYKDPRFNKNVDPRTGYTTKNLLCVPLRTPNGPILGVFQVLNKRAGVFTTTDQEILEILASQAARAIEHAMEWDSLKKKNVMVSDDSTDLKDALTSRDPLHEIVGHTKQVQDVRSLIRKVAGTETTVIILGESGTGKELVARAVHSLSSRSNETLICLNCAAVPADLIESELFGHKKGSFTGAVSDHKGVFRSAHNGTLFIDEVEAMSPAMQVKLLRAIQIGEIKPVGENTAQTVNVRLITATNKDIQDLVTRGQFREDLFYRINVFPITIPPLRERLDDIPLLVRHFLELLSNQSGKLVRGIDPAALDVLMRYHWPGNIRELENEIERAHILAPPSGNVSIRCLSKRITQALERQEVERGSEASVKLKDAVDKLEKNMILGALDACSGNKTWAAKKLGLSRQGLINKIQKFGFKQYMN